MAKNAVVPADLEIEKALTQAKLYENDPVAQNVEHVPGLNLLIVGLSNHRRLVLPVEDMQGLEHATDEQLANYELLGRGTGIRFPALDADFNVPALIEGVYGNRRWMAELGKKGGDAKTEAKRHAARQNGAKGGRPKRAVIVSA